MKKKRVFDIATKEVAIGARDEYVEIPLKTDTWPRKHEFRTCRLLQSYPRRIRYPTAMLLLNSSKRIRMG
jgi:hypothetical protein